MQQSTGELLHEIQKKRKLMVESARKNGFTSDVTIRYSQELDELIFDYQCLIRNSTRREQEVKHIIKQAMVVWPMTLVNA